jgi:hypothetical protein
MLRRVSNEQEVSTGNTGSERKGFHTESTERMYERKEFRHGSGLSVENFFPPHELS